MEQFSPIAAEDGELQKFLMIVAIPWLGSTGQLIHC